MNKTHSHPDPKHIMTTYRGHVLNWKRKYGSARGLFAYKEIVREYLRCKADVIGAKKSAVSGLLWNHE